MLSVLLFAILGSSLVLAHPKRNFHNIRAANNCVLEEKPWILTNIVSFTSAKNKHARPMHNATSFVSFDFQDVNTGLQLNTSCFRQTNTTSAVDPDNYYLCQDIDVEFIWDGHSLQVARRFKNECLGQPPYDQEQAFGHANTTLQRMVTSNGTIATQKRLLVPITALA